MAGVPILPDNRLPLVSGEMRSLHESVLRRELELLKMKDPAYSVFAAKVPVDWGFCDKPPADVMFLRFDDIFNMFHTRRL